MNVSFLSTVPLDLYSVPRPKTTRYDEFVQAVREEADKIFTSISQGESKVSHVKTWRDFEESGWISNMRKDSIQIMRITSCSVDFTKSTKWVRNGMHDTEVRDPGPKGTKSSLYSKWFERREDGDEESWNMLRIRMSGSAYDALWRILGCESIDHERSYKEEIIHIVGISEGIQVKVVSLPMPYSNRSFLVTGIVQEHKEGPERVFEVYTLPLSSTVELEAENGTVRGQMVSLQRIRQVSETEVEWTWLEKVDYGGNCSRASSNTRAFTWMVLAAEKVIELITTPTDEMDQDPDQEEEDEEVQRSEWSKQHEIPNFYTRVDNFES